MGASRPPPRDVATEKKEKCIISHTWELARTSVAGRGCKVFTEI